MSSLDPPADAGRRQSVTVDVGGIPVGSADPIVVQSMTNTDTVDADATAIQVARLAHAGSELVRVTVNTEEAAAAVPEMVRKVRGLGVDVPIIGDFHYNGHKLLVEYPEMAALLAKYRINPGNVVRSATTSTSRRSSRSRSTTGNRSGSASTGGRSTRPS